MDNPVIQKARRALHELVEDEPLGVRVTNALAWLQPISDNPFQFEHRDVIVEGIDAAADPNATLPERAHDIAETIATIFSCCPAVL